MKASSNIPCLLLAVLVTLGASSVQATKTSDATMFKCSTSAGGKIEVTDGDHKGVEVECKMQRKPTHPVNVVIESTKHVCGVCEGGSVGHAPY